MVPGAYGVTIRADTAGFEPRVAAGLSAARFTLLVRGQQIAVSLTARRLLVTPSPYVAGPVPVRVFVDAVAQTVEAGQAVDFPIPRPAAAAVDGLRRPAA